VASEHKIYYAVHFGYAISCQNQSTFQTFYMTTVILH